MYSAHGAVTLARMDIGHARAGIAHTSAGHGNHSATLAHPVDQAGIYPMTGSRLAL